MSDRIAKECEAARNSCIEKCNGIGECGNPQRARRQIKRANRRAGKMRKYKARAVGDYKAYLSEVEKEVKKWPNWRRIASGILWVDRNPDPK